MLIDECLPTALHKAFPDHDVRTVAHMHWGGSTDSQLFELADGRFDVLLTADRSVRYQQRLERRSFGLVIVPGTVLVDLLALVEEIELAITRVTPGEVYDMAAR